MSDATCAVPQGSTRRFLKRFVRKWVRQNSSRFVHIPRHAPELIRGRCVGAYRFGDLADQLSFRVQANGHLLIAIEDSDGRYWDWLTDFDLAESRDTRGRYFDSLEMEPDFYDKRSAMWAARMEFLLEWINERNADEFIELYADGDLPETSEKFFGAEIGNSEKCFGGDLVRARIPMMKISVMKI